MVVFVASERASFLTGANVLVDGGATGGIQLEELALASDQRAANPSFRQIKRSPS